MKKILIVFATILFFCGCYTQKKAEQQAEKALDKYPVPVGEMFRKEFPCVSDSIGDSTAIKEWMAAVNETAQFYEDLLKSKPEFDTIIKWNKDEACEENYNMCAGQYKELYDTHKLLKQQFDKILRQKPPVRVDTVEVKDTYDFDMAISAKEKCETDFRQISKEKTTVEKERGIWRLIAIGLAAALLVILLVRRK